MNFLNLGKNHPPELNGPRHASRRWAIIGFLAHLGTLTLAAASLVLEQGSVQPGGTVLRGGFLGQIVVGGVDIASGFDPGKSLQLEVGTLPIDSKAFFGQAITITGIKPESAAPGDTVTLSGSGLLLARIVLVGGTPTRFTIIDDQTILFVMPPTPVAGRVLVASLNGKVISQDLVSPILPLNGPQVASVNPTVVHPGDSIFIKGSYLGTTTNLLFGTNLVAFNIQDDSTLQAKAPNLLGSFPLVIEAVSVTTGTKQVITVQPAPVPPKITNVSPTSAPRGSLVTLVGIGLSAVSTLSINGSPAQFSIQDDSHLLFTIPDDATTGAVRIETTSGGEAVSNDLIVSLPVPRPWFDASTVLQGHPGDWLIVRGSGFDRARQVLIGGISANFNLHDAGEMEVQIPDQGQSGPLILLTDNDSITSEHSVLVRIPNSPPPPPPLLDFIPVPTGDDAPLFAFHAEPNVSYVVEAINDLGLQVWEQSQGVQPSPLAQDIVLPKLGIDAEVRQQFFRVAADAIPFDNWDFEQGITGWTTYGDAFINQPTFGESYYKDDVNAQPIVDAIGGDYWSTPVHIGHHGVWWIGSGQFRTNEASPPLRNAKALFDARTGRLESPRFVLDMPFLSFLIGGASTSPLPDTSGIRPRVQLQVQPRDKHELTNWIQNPFFRNLKNGYFVVSETGLIDNDQEQLRRVVLDVTGFTNRNARIAIDDGDPNGHINVDDFQFLFVDPTPNLILARYSGATPIYRDLDAPVWGFADTHAHPASQVGFGGQLIAGLLDDRPEIALRECDYVHGFNGSNIKVVHHSDTGSDFLGDLLDFGSGLTTLGGLLGTSTIIMDTFTGSTGQHPLSGYQYGFDGWPSIAEQGVHAQMYVDWIRRAWQGGLRLMVAHSVNNRLLGELNGNNGLATDDPSVADRQIAAIKAMVGRHPDFMEVALTPKDARRIIHQGRLAIVLGIEGDQLAGLRINEGDNVQALTNYLDHIYLDLGVRHVFPIHLADNVFGGCAIYNAFWDNNSWYLNGTVFDARSPASLGIPDPIYFRLPLPNDFYETGFQAIATIMQGLNFRISPPIIGNGLPVANARSLTDIGQTLILELMKRHMIIDTDHSGYLARNRILDIVSARNYPVVSGHCGFTELSLSPAVTDDLEKVAAESDNTPTVVGRLAMLNAMVSPITFSKETDSWGTLVQNDCPGSAKTWAQQYLYAIDKFGGHNVGLGTDYGLTHGISPRFGFNASFGASGDYSRAGLVQAFRQTNGIRYFESIGDYRASRFNGWMGGSIDSHPGAADGFDLPLAGLSDHYQGVALYLSGVDPDTIPYPRPTDRPKFIARGMRASNQADLDFALSHDLPLFPDRSKDEIRAGYYVVHGLTPTANDSDYVSSLVPDLRKVYQEFLNMEGTNRPMHRCQMNCIVEADPNKPWVKEWDFNLDGLAHYGLLPDFIQDLKNVGVDEEHLKPLFGSAEDYIRIWERCVAN